MPATLHRTPSCKVDEEISMMFRTSLLAVSMLVAADGSVAAIIGSAPLPPQISAAKRVFISNMGGQCSNYRQPGFAGTGQPLHHGLVSPQVPSAYGTLYAAIESWGRYRLTLSPADADLVFQLKVSCPFSGGESHPVVDLQIVDPTTRVSLWGFVEEADPAALQKNRDANFERTVEKIVEDVKSLSARASAVPSATN